MEGPPPPTLEGPGGAGQGLGDEGGWGAAESRGGAWGRDRDRDGTDCTVGPSPPAVA